VAKKLNAAGISTPLIEETTDIDRFTQAITEGKASTKFGAQVSILSPEDYANARLFLTPDGKAGFAILNGNELVSLFNHRDSPYRLSKIYKRLGFKEVGRYPWDEELKVSDWDYETYKKWNNGRPDYLEMEYDPDG
jgi:hypothetical protein